MWDWSCFLFVFSFYTELQKWHIVENLTKIYKLHINTNTNRILNAYFAEEILHKITVKFHIFTMEIFHWTRFSNFNCNLKATTTKWREKQIVFMENLVQMFNCIYQTIHFNQWVPFIWHKLNTFLLFSDLWIIWWRRKSDSPAFPTNHI